MNNNERIDDLQINGRRIIQSPDRFCFGMDAVLLSGFAKVKKGESVLDLGTGTGILPILLDAKTVGGHFTGLEIQPESADMARRSVILNNRQDKIDIVTGDIKNALNIFGAASFDVIVTNPPYMNQNHGITNPESPKAIARHELLCSLEDVIRQTRSLLKVNGRMYMVHRPFRLPDIMELMNECGIEPKKMRFVHPYVDREPSMVLIEGVRGGNRRLTVEKPLVIYDGPGEYSEEIKRNYGF
jgi:ribosomal protein L11 methyltransferase (prmA)